MSTKSVGLSTPLRRKNMWTGVEWAEQNIYPKICPVSGSQDSRCLWSFCQGHVPTRPEIKERQSRHPHLSDEQPGAWREEDACSGPPAWVEADLLLRHCATPTPTHARDHSEGLKLDVSILGNMRCIADMAASTSFASRHSRKPTGPSLHSDMGDLGHRAL